MNIPAVSDKQILTVNALIPQESSNFKWNKRHAA